MPGYFCHFPLTQKSLWVFIPHKYPHLRLRFVSRLGCEVKHTVETPQGEGRKGQERFVLSFFKVKKKTTKKKRETVANGLKMSQGIIKEIFLR